MKSFGYLILLAALAACSGDEAGTAKGCTATQTTDGWAITCADSSAVVPSGDCATESDGPTTTIRCADGTEAVVVNEETLDTGAIVGRVVFVPGGDAAGARVEVVGTTYATETRADGSFLLEQLPPGVWSIRASLAPWAPMTVDGIVVLPGTFDAGTLQLTLGGRIGNASVNHAAQALLHKTARPEVEYLADGRTVVCPDEADEAAWWTTETIYLKDNRNNRIGIWEIASGRVAWWGSMEARIMTTDGLLAQRRNEAGVLELWFHWLDRDVLLGTTDSSMSWRAATMRPIWLVMDENGLSVVDGTLPTPVLRNLDPRQAFSTNFDAAGYLVIATFGAEHLLFDLDGDGDPIAVSHPSAIIEGGLAIWTDADGTFHSYDAMTNHHRVLPAGATTRFSGSTRRWLAWAEAGIWYVQPRGGGATIELGTDGPPGFSPSETRVIIRRGDGTLLLRDLDTDEQHVVDGLTGTAEFTYWFDDEWIAVEYEEGGGLLASFGNLRMEFDADIGDKDAKGEHVLLERLGRGLMANAATGTQVDLGAVELLYFDSTGNYVLWTTPWQRMRGLNLETGVVHDLGDGVTSFDPYPDVLFYTAVPVGGGAAQRHYTPYP